MSTRVTAPLASELKRLATVPAVKSLILKSERSSIGSLTLCSMTTNAARRATPVPRSRTNWSSASKETASRVIAARTAARPPAKVTFPRMSIFWPFFITASSFSL